MQYVKGFTIGPLAVALILPLLTVTTLGHETRLAGPNQEYKLVVGFAVEPAFEDAINGIDISISRASDGKPINDSLETPDVVSLEVEVQFRDHDHFDSNILASTILEEPLKRRFGTENRYNAPFRPTHDGAYAFRIHGIVSDESDPKAGPVEIDETFVCGEGSLVPGHGFNCVRDPQTFPGEPESVRRRGEEIDRDGYKDNDGF